MQQVLRSHIFHELDDWGRHLACLEVAYHHARQAFRTQPLLTQQQASAHSRLECAESSLALDGSSMILNRNAGMADVKDSVQLAIMSQATQASKHRLPLAFVAGKEVVMCAASLPGPTGFPFRWTGILKIWKAVNRKAWPPRGASFYPIAPRHELQAAEG